MEHLAIALDTSGRRFAERRDRPAMRRRPRGVVAWLAYHCVVGLGWFPGGFRAPAGTQPADVPDPAAVAGRFLEGHARFQVLAPLLVPARRANLFVRHPVLGDLTFEEWRRFHVVHCHHHAAQIRRRLSA